VQKEERRRLNVEIPIPLYDDFGAFVKEMDMSIVEGIREAMRMRLKNHKKQKMAEGYEALREKHLALMEEFKYVDQELW